MPVKDLNSKKHTNTKLQEVLKFCGRKHPGVNKSQMAEEVKKRPLTHANASNNVSETEKFIRSVFSKPLKSVGT